MVISSDIIMKGETWYKVIENLKEIFTSRPNYMIYIMALATGIMYDKRIGSDTLDDTLHKSVPRNVINNNDNGRLDFFFQAAIITTATEDLSEEERLELAFGDESEFNKMAFLTEFANYGATKLEELIADTAVETMENLKNFCVSTVEGYNFEVDEIPDEEIEDMIDSL